MALLYANHKKGGIKKRNQKKINQKNKNKAKKKKRNKEIKRPIQNICTKTSYKEYYHLTQIITVFCSVLSQKSTMYIYIFSLNNKIEIN